VNNIINYPPHMPDYSKKQLQELYEQLPEDLRKAVFSEQIGEKIQNILNKNNLKDQEKFLNIMKNVGYVFLGLLAPEEFKKNILKKDLKIKEADAENIFSAINSEIFLNLKDSLEALYGIKLKEGKNLAEKNNSNPPRKDKYKEPID